MAGVPDQATGGSQPEEDAESEMSSPMNEPDQPQEVKVEYEEHVRLWEEKMVLEKQVLENTVCELRGRYRPPCSCPLEVTRLRR